MDLNEARVVFAQAAAVFAMVAAAADINNANRRRRSIWTREWIRRREAGRGILSMVHEELAVEDTDAFRNYLRMTEVQFRHLVHLVRQDIERQNTPMRNAISPEKRLSLTLRFLATGESYRSLMYSSRIHESTISLIIPEVCRSLYRRLKGQYLKIPRTQQEWEEVAEKFHNIWNFPMCLGAMDGKHIAFRPPATAGSFYFNYKGGHSIVLLAVVDAGYKFIYVDVGVNGRISDGGVFRESSLARAIAHNSLNFPPNKVLRNGGIEVPYVFVADDAFPLSTRILKPYPMRGLTDEQRIYNYRLSRARRVVENAFGIMSNRFRVFLSPINLSPEKVETIVLASVALHNYLCTNNGVNYLGNEQGEPCRLLRMPHQVGNRAANTALQVREEFKVYFINNER